MLSRCLQGAFALVLAFLSACPALAQEPPGMLATSEYLFVIRGGRLYQYDVHTLELRNTAVLGQGAAGGAVKWFGVAEVPSEVVEVVEVEEEPLEPEEIVEEPVIQELVIEDDGTPRGGAGGAYGGRGGRARMGADKSARAIEMGLDWLVRHQDDDGKWDVDAFMKHDNEGEPCDGAGNAVHDVGMTGLAMLAMLGDGSTLRSGPHKDALKRAAQWMRSQQGEDGMFGKPAAHDFIYDHAIATYAMCEAYGLSEVKSLKSCAQKAIDYLEMHRNPYAVWRYQPRDGDNDTSVTSWCLLALKSGQFFGLNVNPNSLQMGLAWLDQVTTPDGRVGYTKKGEMSSRMPGDHASRFPVTQGEALTAAGLFLRFFLGVDPKESRIMQASADRLLASLPKWDEDAGSIDHYYWYYGTYAMYQVGGSHWKKWSRRMTDAVVRHQESEGNERGSWDPVGVWGQAGGRVYSTALMTLSLQAYYRYTRLIR